MKTATTRRAIAPASIGGIAIPDSTGPRRDDAFAGRPGRRARVADRRPGDPVVTGLAELIALDAYRAAPEDDPDPAPPGGLARRRPAPSERGDAPDAAADPRIRRLALAA
jgi:hypothetical protein